MKTIQEKITAGVILLVWMVAIGVYGVMPERMATHWDAQGMANGYSGKVFGLFLMPVIMVGIQLLCILIPRIDPLKENSKAFKRQFDGFALLIVVFMAYLYGVTLVWNFGMRFGMNAALASAFGLLFYGIGSLLKGVKRNWFIGIRTPWTLSSDKVWDQTHKVGSVVFKIIGAFALFGALFPRYAIAFMLVPALVGAIGIVIYSYGVFQKEK